MPVFFAGPLLNGLSFSLSLRFYRIDGFVYFPIVREYRFVRRSCRSWKLFGRARFRLAPPLSLSSTQAYKKKEKRWEEIARTETLDPCVFPLLACTGRLSETLSCDMSMLVWGFVSAQSLLRPNFFGRDQTEIHAWQEPNNTARGALRFDRRSRSIICDGSRKARRVLLTVNVVGRRMSVEHLRPS